MPRTCLIVGVGLIGGSLGLALGQNPNFRVLGADPDEKALAQALQLGAIAERVELARGVARAEAVIIATPVEEVIPTLRAILPYLSQEALVLDTASTKGAITQRAGELLPRRFIGGHPMAGSERAGIEAADPYLFENAPFILCPPEGVVEETLELAEKIVQAAGSLPIYMSAQQHDEIVGMVSHLPHLCAVALLNTLATVEERERAMELAAGGFRDLTRVASGNPGLWRGILASNRWVVASLLRKLQKSLGEQIALLENGDLDGLEALLTRAQKIRTELPQRRKGLLGTSFELVLSLPDRPGSLAEVTAILAQAQLNIQDLEILRVREGEGGTVKLSFAEDAVRAQAQAQLKAAGYSAVLQSS